MSEGSVHVGTRPERREQLTPQMYCETQPGGGTRNRTADAGIFSPSLYRLSYPADKQSDYRVTIRACKMGISSR